MASNTNRTIYLKGQEDGARREAVASEAITPGHLIEYTTAGQVRKHATAAGNAYPLFAGENEVFGLGIDDAYAANDRVLGWHAKPGDEINAVVAAAAPAIVIGDRLESAGNGTLRKHTAPAPAAANIDGAVAIAMEAVDNSGGGSAVRIRVMVL